MKRFLVFFAVILLLTFLTVTFVAGFAIGRSIETEPAINSTTTTPEDNPADITIIQEVMGQLAHNYVDKVERKQLIDGAVDGMVKTLKDPYSRYLIKKEYDTFQEHATGRFGGVGIELGMRNDNLTVIAPIKNTPAEKAGVQAGDLITKIEDQSTKGMSLEKAVKLIRGPQGTKVRLTFKRDSKTILEKEIVRGEIKLPNITGKIISKDIAYLKTHAFNGETATDIRKELNELKKKEYKGIIIDLRNNPGGLLTEAIQVSSIFIKEGTIVKVKQRNGHTENFSASNNADDKTPLVLLINKGSASASEIFAGAVQDTGRGTLVGEKTFGKGSVQTVVPLSNGNGLVMTTAKYLTPKGRSLNKKGVTPDVKVILKKKDFHKMSSKNDPQLKKAQEIMNDLLAGKKIKKSGK